MIRIIYFVKLSILTLFLGIVNFAISYWAGIGYERVLMMIISFFSIFVLFEFLFEIIHGKQRKGYLIKYFVFSTIKIFTILAVAYLFLNAKNIENRYEVLVFLFNYLAYLAFDIALKVKAINKNTY